MFGVAGRLPAHRFLQYYRTVGTYRIVGDPLGSVNPGAASTFRHQVLSSVDTVMMAYTAFMWVPYPDTNSLILIGILLSAQDTRRAK
jgi:hypothetical protein